MCPRHAGDLFELLRDGRPRTRAELAESTGLARSTVAARIDQLMRLGLVAPSGGTSTGGRPPSLFAMNPEARLVAGVDVGATHVALVLADLSGRIHTEDATVLDVSEGPEAVLSWVTAAIAERLTVLGRRPTDLAAIGMGLPGPVEHATGRPTNPPIMPGWDRYDVPARVQRELDVPVLVDNDVNIMALGELAAFPGTKDLVFVKVATGIGAGIISGGALQRGAQGTAGDLGHVRVARAGEVTCRCGNSGCLEAVAAGPALATALREAGVPARTSQDVVDLTRA
ncbi:MAG: ROK family protein, partial [Ornithinibacter sp.]